MRELTGAGEQLPLVDAGLEDKVRDILGAVGGYLAKVPLTQEKATAVYQVCGALRLDDSWRPQPVALSEGQLASFNSQQRPPEPSALSLAIVAALARLVP